MSLHLALMSVAQLVRDYVVLTPERSFLSPADVQGTRHAVECELSRLATAGDIIRVRKGLYWKGPMTAIGMPLPRPYEVGLAVAGPGSGPASLSAAAHLGLTTQVPSVETIAVPGRVPTEPRGLRFLSRSIERRIRALRPTEIAVIEVLRDGPDQLEAPWRAFADTVERLADDAEIRPALITEEVDHERHVAARERWSELLESVAR